MDHAFFTHQLGADQTGWDWFSLQLDDGSDLMLFRLRRKDGTADPFSAGTYVDPQGRARHLAARDFTLQPGRKWRQYPVEWTIRVPGLHLDLAVTTPLDEQELTSAKTGAYWEGAIAVSGSQRGAGYLEMTGYAAPVKMADAYFWKYGTSLRNSTKRTLSPMLARSPRIRPVTRLPSSS